jgi:hypothetical protein
MSVLKALRQRVAPELNFLLTDDPAERAGAIDCGWRPHLHAYHAFLVARMFGAAAELRTGDIAVISGALPPITTLDREPKHAWCAVGGVTPVDLAATFARFPQAPQLRSPVTGEGPNGDWQVRYAEDESILDQNIEGANELLYIARSPAFNDAVQLLDEPGRFIPAAEEPEGWVARHGVGVHAAVALHGFRCAGSGGRSVRNQASRDEAVAAIVARYPDARAEILRLIAV